MKVSIEDVEYVADLSRIILDNDEKEIYRESLNKILDYVDKLGELDTTNVDATTHVLPLKNVFREDNVVASMNRDNILKNAPDSDEGCFRVPKIVE